MSKSVKSLPTPAPVASVAPAKPAPKRTGRVLPSLATAPAPTPAPVASPVAAAPAGFRPAACAPTARLTVVSAACPKRPGSKASRAWLAYSDAKGKPVTSVAEALKRFAELGFPPRYARSALLWDSRHGFIEIAK